MLDTHGMPQKGSVFSMYQKNNVPESFPDCLKHLLTKHSLSASQLADLLQYRSKTTLLRVLQGKAGIRCIGNVYSDLCLCKALELTDEEIDRLHTAYEVELWGMETYRAKSEMRRLLRKWEFSVRSMVIHTGDGRCISLEDFLAQFHPAAAEDISANAGEGISADAEDRISVKKLEVCVLSAGYPDLVSGLADLLHRFGDRISVQHIVPLTGDTARTVRLIRNILPVIGYHNYEVYYNWYEDFAPDPMYSYSGTGRSIILRAFLPDESTREFQLLIRDESTGILLEAPGLWQHWMQYAAPYMEQMQALKITLPETAEYTALLEYYGEKERNRECLVFKGDVCFHHIPTEILLHALMDSTDDDSILQTLPRLRSLQEKRFQNIMTKRQPTHWVASPAALRQFAAAGLQKDHFFAMRPFTGEERLRIFRHLLSLVRENPYYHLYLLRPEEEDSFIDLEATYLEGAGLQLTSPGTHYCIADGWTETMLMEDGFCRLYREFFLEELIPHYTLPQEDTVAFLEEMIRELQEKKE